MIECVIKMVSNGIDIFTCGLKMIWIKNVINKS